MILLVENESHCDFTKLREMLIRTNMEDLRDTTHTKHYELYRKDRLQQVMTQLRASASKVGSLPIIIVSELFEDGISGQLKGLNVNHVQSSTEYVPLKMTSKPMPHPLFGHTILQIEEDVFMLIGGKDSSGNTVPKTYILQDNQIWTEGPNLLEGRFWHTAGVIIDQITKKKSVIVVGGRNRNGHFNSVEMLSLPIEANITIWQPGI